MMNFTYELYGDNDIAELKRRIKRRQISLCAIAAAALAVCVLLIALIGAENSWLVKIYLVAVIAVAGCIIISGQIFAITAVRRELKHAEMLRSGEKCEVIGLAYVTDERVKIPHSITARRVEISGDGEIFRVLVCETRVNAIESAETVTFYTVNGFISAFDLFM